MAEKLDSKELVSFEELLRANMIQTDAVTQLLIERGVNTEEEFYIKPRIRGSLIHIMGGMTKKGPLITPFSLDTQFHFFLIT